MADRMLTDLVERVRAVDQQDREDLIALIERQMQELSEYIAVINARPHAIERCDPNNPKTSWQEMELRPIIDNPAQRRWDEFKRHRHRRLTHGNGSRVTRKPL